MKKLLPFIFGLLIPAVIACKQPGKSKLVKTDKNHSAQIIRNVYIDDEFAEDEMEVIINKTTNEVTINLNGETYVLTKNIALPNYTAENVGYKYSDIEGEITFLKRDVDMVIFHHKQEPIPKKQIRTISYK